jgi:hypothetical protein
MPCFFPKYVMFFYLLFQHSNNIVLGAFYGMALGIRSDSPAYPNHNICEYCAVYTSDALSSYDS